MVHRKSSSVSVGGQNLPPENLHDGEGATQRAEVGQLTGGHGSGAGGSGSGSGGDASQRVDAARTALLRSKQAELDAIEEKHDDLVRLSRLWHRAPFSGGCATPRARFYSLFADYVATRGVSSGAVDDIGYV